MKKEKTTIEVRIGDEVIASVDGDSVNYLDKPLSYIFDPKEDITAYELAMCTMFILCDGRISLNECAPYARHFKVME